MSADARRDIARLMEAHDRINMVIGAADRLCPRMARFAVSVLEPARETCLQLATEIEEAINDDDDL